MQAFVCRVNRAFVERNRQTVGGIAQGLLVLLSVDQRDGEEDVEWMAHRLIELRDWSTCHTDLDDPPSANELLLVSSAALADGLHPDAMFAVWEPADARKSQQMLERLAKRCGRGVHVGQHDLVSSLVIEARLDGPVVNVLDSHQRLTPTRQVVARDAQQRKPVIKLQGVRTVKKHHHCVSALVSVILALVSLSWLAGCNTIEGIGEGVAKDARATSDLISDSEGNSTHQSSNAAGNAGQIDQRQSARAGE